MLTILLTLVCSPPRAAQEAGAERPAALVIEGGYAQERPLTPGTQIRVWAHLRPADQVFLGWEGPAAQYLNEKTSWYAVLTVPEAGLADPRLQARVADVAIRKETLSFTGVTTTKDLQFLAPEARPARALAFFFHDSDSNFDAFKLAEVHNFALTLVHHGYAVAAFSSMAIEAWRPGSEETPRWNGKEEQLEQNEDMRNALLARAALMEAGVVGKDVPCFAFGTGNGGTFAASATAVLGWKAAASFCGPGRKQILQAHPAPVVWVVGAHDWQMRTAADEAREARKLLEDLGAPAKLYLVESAPLRIEHLVERLGMDDDLARETYAKMQSTGVLDQDGNFIATGAAGFGRIMREKIAYEDLHIWTQEEEFRPIELMVQFDMIHGGHQLNASYAPRVLAFFEAQLGG